MSAASGARVAEWVDRLLATGPSGRRAQDVDYAEYAEAEASLGWLNATVEVTAAHDLLPREVGEALVEAIRRRCVDGAAAVAHVKVLVATEEGSDRVGVTDDAGSPRWSGSADLAPARALSLIVNARVRASPGALERLTREAVADAAARSRAGASVQHLECFSPEAPRPQHRFASGGAEVERGR
jgi:hypothetical protein